MMQQTLVALIVAWSVAVLANKYLPAALRARLDARLAAGLRLLCAQARGLGLVGLANRFDAAAGAMTDARGAGAGACGSCGGCAGAAPAKPANSISVEALKRTIRR
jgi:hypothetical protein